MAQWVAHIRWIVIINKIVIINSVLEYKIRDVNLHGVSGDSFGNCPVRSFWNKEFSSVETEMEGKTPPRGFMSGDRERSIRPRRFSESVHCFIFSLYLKILCIYFFFMHYKIFWLWVLYDYAYFAIHYGMFWPWSFVWLLVKCFCVVFLLWTHYVLFLFFKK
jgi:hypothetical protein